jgi:glyoxylase-like metal-dependent hydrolase (beta-lactamase superfamily II)
VVTSQTATAEALAVGRVSISRVEESTFAVLDPFEVYPDMTPALLEANLSWLAPRFFDRAAARLNLAFQGFVVRSSDALIVVDTCVGDCKSRRRASFDQQTWGWLDRMKAAGVDPTAVTHVVCTHFHVDHVGGNTRLDNGQWVPSFPNARYLFPRAEFDYWASEAGTRSMQRTGDYLADSVLPVITAGQAELVAGDHALTAGIGLRPAPGHTPGGVVVDVQSDGARALLLGDVLHTLLQIRYPDWSTRFCVDPQASRRTRLDILRWAADRDVWLLPNHFPAPSAGRVERWGDGYNWRFAGEAAPVFG